MSVEVGMDSSVSPWSVFFGKKVSKNTSNRISMAFADIILSEKQSNYHIGTFLYLIKSRWFFLPLFQLLPTVGFLAPPLSTLHMVVSMCPFFLVWPTTQTCQYKGVHGL